MDRNQAKELLPIIKAFSEGKGIETKTGSGWISIENMSFAGNPKAYRIQSEPKYHPFANAEECWTEMLKHQPFGWIKPKSDDVIGKFMLIDSLMDKVVTVRTNVRFKYHELLEHYTFADGTPFGVKKIEEDYNGIK